MLKQTETQRRAQGKRWLIEYPRAAPLLIFFLVTAITVLSIFSIERSSRIEEIADLNRESQMIGATIERRAFSNSSYLRAGAALLSAGDQVSADLFSRFVSELRLDANNPGAGGIGWAPVIGAAEVPAIERQLRRGRTDRPRISPTLTEQPRDKLVPVLYIRPETPRNQRALGFDMYSNPVRRRAMDKAEREARPTASGIVTLRQEGREQNAGFLIYMPVFDANGGGRLLKGFIYSPFNAKAFLSSAIDARNNEGVAVRLWDKQTGTLMGEEGEWRENGQSITRDLNLANNEVSLVVQQGRDTSLSPLSLITLLFGLAVASLLTLVARLLTRQAEEDHRSLEWFAEQNSIRNSLTRELNHRVKNTLANVLSIVSMTRRRTDSLDEFAEGIDNRIRALSATHDLLTQSDWGTTPLRSVVEVELSPYVRGEDQQISLEGPSVELAPNDALSLGLAIHELATNATKYGALSVPGGRVHVIWTLIEPNRARIEWQERGGPVVEEPRTRGFGTDLIEKIVSHELRNPVELDFDPQGVRCVLRIPVRNNGEFMLRSKTG